MTWAKGRGGTADAGLLYWIDGLGDKLFRYTIPVRGRTKHTTSKSTLDAPYRVRDGGMLLALQDGVYKFDTLTGHYELLSDIEREIKNNRLNDGKVDSQREAVVWKYVDDGQPER